MFAIPYTVNGIAWLLILSIFKPSISKTKRKVRTNICQTSFLNKVVRTNIFQTSFRNKVVELINLP